MEGSKIIAVGLPKGLGGTAWDYSRVRRFGEGGSCAGASASAKCNCGRRPEPEPRPHEFANEKARHYDIDTFN